MLHTSQITMLNEIIKKIYTIEDFTEMRKVFLSMLKTLIPFKAGTFYLASHNPDHLLGSPVSIEITEQELQYYIDHYEATDYTRWIFMSGKTMVYRETDLFSDEVRSQYAYFTEMYLGAGYYYSTQMSLADGGVFLGIVSLFNSKEAGNFTDADLFILDLLTHHLAWRVAQEHEKSLKNTSQSEMKNKSYFDAYGFIENYSLTAREVEVLGLLLAGLSGEKICEALVISANTLKKHALSIYKKLGINNRWELIKFKP